MNKGALPDVFSYLSYRQYLNDWYESRKHADQRYSHRLFCRRAGVRSPSLLSEVSAGKRNLTPNTLEGFIRALELTHEEAAFFQALVAFEQAGTTDEKNDAWQQIATSRRFRSARPIDNAAVSYLSHWYIPAIRELALRRDFRADPAWISKQLQPRVTEAEARGAIDTLLTLGLLVRRDDDSLEPAEVSVATPHQVAGLAAHNYHRQMLQRAWESIESAHPDERHLLGVTVAIPESLVGVLKAELNATQERLLHLCDTHANAAERVYQLNLQLVPLSRSMSE